MIVWLRELKRVCYARAKTITEAVASVATTLLLCNLHRSCQQASDNNKDDVGALKWPERA